MNFSEKTLCYDFVTFFFHEKNAALKVGFRIKSRMFYKDEIYDCLATVATLFIDVIDLSFVDY